MLTLQIFYCAIKKALAVIILLHSFVVISFIKRITGTTQIHQPITLDYFEHQLITDEWAKHVTITCKRYMLAL